MGLDNALSVFAEIRESLGCPVLTDVHDAQQCPIVAEAVDVLFKYLHSYADRRICSRLPDEQADVSM